MAIMTRVAAASVGFSRRGVEGRLQQLMGSPSASPLNIVILASRAEPTVAGRQRIGGSASASDEIGVAFPLAMAAI